MWQARRRKGEFTKFDRIKRQIPAKRETVQVLQIDESPIPKNRRRWAKLNVVNKMKTLHITVDNKDNHQLKMIRPSTRTKVG